MSALAMPMRPRLSLIALVMLALFSWPVAAEAAKAKTTKAKVTTPSSTPASPWQVLKVDGHDYLSVENIAKFYGLPPDVEPVGNKIHLENDKGSLQFTLNSREISINGLRNWLSFPVVAKDGKFLVSRTDLAETIEPQMRPRMIKNLGKVTTIVLDPGHGGYDKGATSRFGSEKDYTLDVARQLRPLLRAKGFRVLMTREGDYFVPLEVRARIANAAPDSIFVSIHFNAADANPSATGFEIYSLTPLGAPSTHDDWLTASSVNAQNGTPVDVHSIELSACIYHSVLGHIAEFDRGIKRARFAVLRLTKVPAVLVEGGFLTERGESQLIANKEWRGKLAESICLGIDSYRGLADRKERPLLVKDYHRKDPELFPAGISLQPSEQIAAVPPLPPPAVPAPSATPSPAPVDWARGIVP
jgi:N-acetylmuramoyl-L-alanine amidase